MAVTVIETETGELSQLLRELMKSVLRETPTIRPKWLTRSQVAVYLNVNKATIDLWRKKRLTLPQSERSSNVFCG